MRIVRYRKAKFSGYGVLQGSDLFPVVANTLQDALKMERDGAKLALSDVQLLSPVERPGKILAIGLNYAAHAAESVSFAKLDAGGVQKWFNKQATAINDPYGKVHLPKVSDQLDYEGELVAVIGKRGRHVSEARALQIVAGLTIGCDYSVRDWQRASPTMIMGKGFDSHAPIGPALVTLDEFGEIGPQRIRTHVNGEERQNAATGDMIHALESQIAHLTAAFTLEPGDLIFTGTPAGVGAGMEPPQWLKAGDVVRVEIDGLGHIENTIVTEPGDMVIGNQRERFT